MKRKMGLKREWEDVEEENFEAIISVVVYVEGGVVMTDGESSSNHSFENLVQFASLLVLEFDSLLDLDDDE